MLVDVSLPCCLNHHQHLFVLRYVWISHLITGVYNVTLLINVFIADPMTGTDWFILLTAEMSSKTLGVFETVNYSQALCRWWYLNASDLVFSLSMRSDMTRVVEVRLDRTDSLFFIFINFFPETERPSYAPPPPPAPTTVSILKCTSTPMGFYLKPLILFQPQLQPPPGFFLCHTKWRFLFCFQVLEEITIIDQK